MLGDNDFFNFASGNADHQSMILIEVFYESSEPFRLLLIKEKVYLARAIKKFYEHT
jgi:hypothetical protein